MHQRQKEEEKRLNNFETQLGHDEQQLRMENANLKKELETHIIPSHVIEAKLEDQVNRSCRKSLVFKGIPESNNQKETWEETKTFYIQTMMYKI